MKSIAVLVFTLFAINTYATDVTLVIPVPAGNSFWDRVAAISHAAAKDLDIKLKIVHGDGNRRSHYEKIESICKGNSKPDFLIISPWFGNAKKTFETINSARIPFITMERTLREAERLIVAHPQVYYQHWIGEVYHDNVHAGELLATSLIENSIESSPPDKAIKIIGIGGTPDGESHGRVNGLIEAAGMYDNVEVIHVLNANYSRQESTSIVSKLLTKYEEFDVIWAASDDMAHGAAKAVSSNKTQLRLDNTNIGGIDWTIEAIRSIKSGHLDASVGGHIMQGAWALIQIFDHNNGKQVFVKGDQPATYKLALINKDNIDQFSVIAEQPDWDKVDFLSLTRTANVDPSLLFNVQAVIKQLN